MSYELRRLFTTAKHLGLLGLVALALAAGPVAAQTTVDRSAFDRFMGVVVGNNTTVGYGAGGVPLATSAGALGSGYQPLGNMQTGINAGALEVKGDAVINLPNGRTAPLSVASAVNKPSMGGALLRFAKKSLPLLSTGYAVYDLFQELGMTVNTSSGSLVVTKPTTTTNCLSNIIPNAADFIAGGQQMLCGSSWITSSGVATLKVAPDTCSVLSTCPDGTQKWNFTWTGTTTPTTAILTDQEIIDAIANKSGWPSTSALAPAVKQAVESGESIKLETPTVTGPATVAGPSSTTNSGSTTTTKNETYNITYNTNNVSYTTTVTTTVNDGTNTTTTTETKTQDKQLDQCEKYPDSVGCKSLDVPLDAVPKTTKNVTFAPENLGFGSGTCPPPISWTDNLGTHSLNLSDYCSMLSTIVKPVVLCMALLAAFFIVAPVKEGVA